MLLCCSCPARRCWVPLTGAPLCRPPVPPPGAYCPRQWDDALIGDGTVGLGALQIRTMMEADFKPRAGSDQHLEIPYGFLTGMADA